MKKIISYNVNGIRAAVKKGLLDWIDQEGVDIIGISGNKSTTGSIAC